MRCADNRLRYSEPPPLGEKPWHYAGSSSRGTFPKSALSNGRAARARSHIQWVESYVAADKTFCVYLAKDEAIIRKHAEISGFPAGVGPGAAARRVEGHGTSPASRACVNAEKETLGETARSYNLSRWTISPLTM
jgi:hypothetical protein